MRMFDEKTAVAIGLEEAIILKQIEYWLKVNEKAGANRKDGYYWVYNSISEWHKQFPFWSFSTVKRIFQSLRDKRILVTARYNRMKNDKSLWYRIDYIALEDYIKANLDQSHKVNLTQSDDTNLGQCNELVELKGQSDPIKEVNLNQPLGQNEPIRKGQSDPTIPNIDYTKNTTKKEDGNLIDSLLGIWERQYQIRTGKEPAVTDTERLLLSDLIDKGISEMEFHRVVKEYLGHKRRDYSLECMINSSA